jgi:hypothetical protein
MDWVLSFLGLFVMEMKGRKMWQSWALGLLQQVLWLWIIYDKEMWGLLLLSAYKIWRHIVFLKAWRTEAEVLV